MFSPCSGRAVLKLAGALNLIVLSTWVFRLPDLTTAIWWWWWSDVSYSGYKWSMGPVFAVTPFLSLKHITYISMLAPGELLIRVHRVLLVGYSWLVTWSLRQEKMILWPGNRMIRWIIEIIDPLNRFGFLLMSWLNKWHNLQPYSRRSCGSKSKLIADRRSRSSVLYNGERILNTPPPSAPGDFLIRVWLVWLMMPVFQ